MSMEWWGVRHDRERLRELRDSFVGARDASSIALEAFLAISDGRPAEALPLAEEAILGVDLLEEVHRGPVLFAMGLAMDESGHFDDARRWFGKAKTAFESSGDRRSAVDALSEIALTWHRQSEFFQALTLQEECLQASRALGYRQGEAHAWNRIANAQDRLGDYVAALDAHQRSLRLRQTLGDGRGEAASLGNIGNIHVQLGAFDDAIRWYETSIARCREVGFAKQEVAVLGNLGLAYQGKSDWKNARRCHEESLVEKEAAGDVHAEANTLGNLANVLVELGEILAAEKAVSRALLLNRRMGERHGETHNLITLVRISSPDDALSAGIRAVALAREIGSRELQYLAHEALAAVYQKRGDFEQALHHFEAFHRLKEDVFTESMAIRTRSLRAQHEMEQARKEGELQRLRKEELAFALAEAERLAREDGLTGLLNRRVGLQRLDEACVQSRRRSRDLSVAVVDVDHFKQINDRFLHAKGDAVLKRLAELFRSACGSADIVARLGGEEFLLAFPDEGADSSYEKCERIRQLVESFDWNAVAPGLSVTLSIGLCADRAVESGESLLAIADARLYEAKRSGRNRVVSKESVSGGTF